MRVKTQEQMSKLVGRHHAHQTRYLGAKLTVRFLHAIKENVRVLAFAILT